MALADVSTLGLRNRPLRVVGTERAAIPPGGRLVLASLPGAGTVLEVFLALGSTTGGVSPAVDTVLQVGPPGQAPELSVDLGTLFASHFAQPGGLNMSGGHAHVELMPGGVGAGYVLTLPMPYQDGLEVALYNPTGEAPLAYAQVFYSPGDAAPVRLRSSAVPWSAHLAVGAQQPVTLLEARGAGWVAWTSLVGVGTRGDGSVGRSWLERNVVISGGDGATLASTGVEDWFASSYYFQDRRSFGTPWSLVGENDPARRVAGMAMDLVARWGGVRYSSGVTVTLAAEYPFCSTDHLQSHAVLYYAEV